MTTSIFIVRHGITAANQDGRVQGQSDTPLSEPGIRQAEALAERFRRTGLHFDAVYSSDLARAMMTAKIITGNGPIVPKKELREWDLGHWVGKTIQEVKRDFPQEYDGFVNDLPGTVMEGGESRQQVHDRAAAFLEDMVRNHSGKQILIVSHCGLIRAMFHHILGIPGRVEKQPQIKNVSLSSVLHDGTCWQLASWNDTAHLEGLVSHTDGY